ncbi:hypothetical protein LCGC14_0542450 [marine sediment metagenome]|uniref:Uncharacterized protein n=1 Tax=marine sediment metagenome TaxID=412755 RepID=A0A0F9RSI0_9ZZZZ
MSNTGITERMWRCYELMYQVERKKQTTFVASWMGISVEEVMTLLADMKKVEPSLFPDIGRDRVRSQYRTKRLGPGDENTARKTSELRSD